MTRNLSNLAKSFRWCVLGVLLLGVSSVTNAEVFRLRGTGTLAGPTPPFGTVGEEISILVDLNTDLLTYDASEAPGAQRFPATSPLSLSVVGATSGVFPDIDPVILLRAVDGTSGSGDDVLEIHNGSTTTSVPLLSLRCAGGDCFDENSSPITAPNFLTALGAALTRPNLWATDSAQFLSNDTQQVHTAENLSWSLRSISHTTSVTATFDVRYLDGGDPVLTEGEEAILVGGFGGDFPVESTAILEFDLSAIPAGALITGATLQIDALSQTGNPNLTIVTYPGDGLASESDGMVDGAASMSGPVNIDTAESLALDAEYVQSLLGTASHLGIRLSSETAGKFLAMGTLENTTASRVPTLLLEFLYEAPLGDFNIDGRVDATDYVVWRNSFGSTTDLAADANGNGEIDTDDYLIWKEQFGTSAGALAATPAAVPEPAYGLLAAALALFSLQRKSRRQ